MQGAPDVPTTAMSTMLQDEYGLRSPTLEFLPLGNDSATFVYRVEASDGVTRFLKLRALHGFRAASLLVPLFLRDRGVPHVLAPLRTQGGAPWLRVPGFAAALYPFLTAQTAAAAGLSPEAWRCLGATLRQVHDTPLPAHLRTDLPSESYATVWHERMARLEARLMQEADPSAGTHADPVASAIVSTWCEHEGAIRALVEGADTLGRHAREAGLSPVLCHADFHTWNVLVDDHAGVWIVDWDEVVLAPKERDLMFVIGGIGRNLVTPDETASFLEGYGVSKIDGRALSYYRFVWALRDIEAYVADALGGALRDAPAAPPEEATTAALDDADPPAAKRSEAARWDAVNGFAAQFEAGNMVDIALGAEALGGWGRDEA